MANYRPKKAKEVTASPTRIKAKRRN
uniref:Uncharacterized protein n=1 Tax=Arundo donax TaxID=35708 RepID=A0A0A9FTF4_ARUDO